MGKKTTGYALISSFFTTNGKYYMVMFRGCLDGYNPTCQLHIRPKMKVDVLSFQIIYDVALSRLKSPILGFWSIAYK